MCQPYALTYSDNLLLGVVLGAASTQCTFGIVMGRTGTGGTPIHRSHGMIIVPFDTPGVTRVRNLTVFGYDGK